MWVYLIFPIIEIILRKSINICGKSCQVKGEMWEGSKDHTGQNVFFWLMVIFAMISSEICWTYWTYSIKFDYFYLNDGLRTHRDTLSITRKNFSGCQKWSKNRHPTFKYEMKEENILYFIWNRHKLRYSTKLCLKF